MTRNIIYMIKTGLATGVTYAALCDSGRCTGK